MRSHWLGAFCQIVAACAARSSRDVEGRGVADRTDPPDNNARALEIQDGNSGRRQVSQRVRSESRGGGGGGGPAGRWREHEQRAGGRRGQWQEENRRGQWQEENAQCRQSRGVHV